MLGCIVYTQSCMLYMYMCTCSLYSKLMTKIIKKWFDQGLTDYKSRSKATISLLLYLNFAELALTFPPTLSNSLMTSFSTIAS